MSYSRPARRPQLRRRRRLLPSTIAGLTLVIALFGFLVTFYTDLLWFRSVGFSKVFTTEIRTRVLLFVLFGLVMAVTVGINLIVAYRLRPPFRPMSPEQQSLERYRGAIAPYLRRILIGVLLVTGLLAGLSASGQWRTWLLWRNGVHFGIIDAQFHRDVSYFAFTYPFQRFVLGFAFAVVLFSLFAALITHYLFGALRLQTPQDKVLPGARAHLSVLFSLLVALKAVAYFLDRYGLAFSQRGVVTGPSYTDVHAVLPAKTILMICAVICAVLLITNIYFRGWTLPAISVGLLVLSAVVIGGIYPFLIQQLRVTPNEVSLEAPYIQRNIVATQAAYGLTKDSVDITAYAGSVSNATQQLASDKATVANARLLDPNILGSTYGQLQRVRSYFGFPGLLDIDRYDVDGTGVRDYVVAVRELDQSGLAPQQRNWINERLTYTHGNGFVMAPANQVDPQGRPIFIEHDVPPVGPLAISQPRIYFGETSPAYSVVDSRQKEIDGPGAPGQEQATFSYDGTGGVGVGSTWRKLLYAWKYHEKNLLLSTSLTKDSKILYIRDPQERVRKVAPYLTVDADPYPAVVNGRILWIVDGYTTSDGFPYAQRTTLAEVTADTLTSEQDQRLQPPMQVNYIRNSVKATVDAYDGTVTLYAFDDKHPDPVLRTWMKVFPGTVKPASAISEQLRAHLRYPEDLFKVQRDLLAKYHVEDPRAFYNQEDFWSVPADPAPGTTADHALPQPPYYLFLQVPGTPRASFQLTTTFLALKRPNLTAYMSASSDPGDYGRIRVLRVPRESVINGVGQVEANLRSFPRISQDITLLGQQQSTVQFGNLLTLPVGGGLLYVQPLYVQASMGESFPVLRKVMVNFGDAIGYADSLSGAIQDMLAGMAAGAGSAPGEHGPPPASGPVAALIARVHTLYTQSQDALRAGDFVRYAQLQQQLGDAIARLVASSGATPSPPASASPTASPAKH